jgi:hypothetical protein
MKKQIVILSLLVAVNTFATVQRRWAEEIAKTFREDWYFNKQ